MLCISAQHGDETLPCSLPQPTKCFLFITFQRCKALQPYLGLYFDFLEDSYKLRCISAGWGSDQNTAIHVLIPSQQDTYTCILLVYS